MGALTYLYQHGLQAEPRAGSLIVYPRALLNDELRAWIRAHKDALLAELEQPAPVAPATTNGPSRPPISVWRARVDGKYLTVIDPAGSPPEQMRASLVARFGERFQMMERKR